MNFKKVHASSVSHSSEQSVLKFNLAVNLQLHLSQHHLDVEIETVVGVVNGNI